jgi:hypothetical protein
MTKSAKTCEHKDAFWLDGNTSAFCEEPETIPVYDLEERTARFGEKVTDFARNIPRSPITDRIINQQAAPRQAETLTMVKPMIRYRKRTSLSALAPARRKR